MALVGAGAVSAKDFWSLTPKELHWLVEAKTPRSVIQEQEDLEELGQMLREAKAREAKKNGG